MAMDLPSQAGEAGGWEIMAGGLLSGRLKAPWWAKGLILKIEMLEIWWESLSVTYSSGGVR